MMYQIIFVLLLPAAFLSRPVAAEVDGRDSCEMGLAPNAIAAQSAARFIKMLGSIGLSETLLREIPLLTALYWAGDEHLIAADLRSSQGNRVKLMLDPSGHFALRVASSRSRSKDQELFSVMAGLLRRQGLMDGFEQRDFPLRAPHFPFWILRVDARDENARRSLRDMLSYISLSGAQRSNQTN